MAGWINGCVGKLTDGDVGRDYFSYKSELVFWLLKNDALKYEFFDKKIFLI